MPEGAKPGDVLLLTKALGTQVRLMKRPWAHRWKLPSIMYHPDKSR